MYAGNCAGCHGAQAEGGVGPGLAEVKTWSEGAFREAVLNGKHPSGRTLGTVMPRFAQTGLDGAPATPEQMTALLAYLQGL
ncbi:c-type cytochrome [Deinococcus multiflagellatus]|uniref:C-type cytochrome n=1 Tax=Deinococcus multiflagellatus TaxID=1656887 RepID=A0ABW1ZV03_9DEIO